MLLTTSAYVKSYDGQTKWIYFLIEYDHIFKRVVMFGIKSELTLKKNWIGKLPIKNYFGKQK